MNVTPLAAVIGYDQAAQVAKEAHQKNKSIRQVALQKKLASPEQLKKVLDPRSMTEPGIAKK